MIYQKMVCFISLRISSSMFHLSLTTLDFLPFPSLPISAYPPLFHFLLLPLHLFLISLSTTSSTSPFSIPQTTFCLISRMLITIFNKEHDYLMKFTCSNLVLNLLINLQFSRQAAMVHTTMLFLSPRWPRRQRPNLICGTHPGL